MTMLITENECRLLVAIRDKIQVVLSGIEERLQPQQVNTAALSFAEFWADYPPIRPHGTE